MFDNDTYQKVLPGYIETASDYADEIRKTARVENLRNVSPLITGYIESQCGARQDDIEQSRFTGLYHPSELPYCLLAAWHRRKGTPFINRLSPKTRLTFDIGHAVHKMLQKRYLPMVFGGANVAIEVPVRDEMLKVSGHADAIVTFDDGLRMLVEIKSKKSIAGMRSPVRQHVMQAHYYMFVERIGVGTVLYVDKSESELVDYPFVFDFNLFEECVDRIVQAELCFQNGNPPPAEPHPYCSECGVNHLCDAWTVDRNRRVSVNTLRSLGRYGMRRDDE